MKRSFRHLTPRYVVNRIKILIDEKLRPQRPWLTSKATDLLEAFLKESDVGVEFGSGRSTIWFAKKIMKLTSIEDNPTWYVKVSRLLEKNNLMDKVNYYLANNEEEYINKADMFEDNSIDFCLIDGTARDLCMKKIIPKIKNGGLLVLDNVNWFMPSNKTKSPASRTINDGFANNIWLENYSKLSNWRLYRSSNGVTDTSIWIKK